MKIGFIGTGSMGSILIESLIRSGALLPEEIAAGNRTFAKAEKLAERYPGLVAARSNIEAAKHRDIVFLCVKPAEYKHVIDEIRDTVAPEQIVVSITSPVLLRQLEDQLPCKIAKVIPSITNFVQSGVTLCMYGERIEEADRNMLENLLSRFSSPIRVTENFTRIISDISSCGPAFLAFLIEKFARAATEETGLPYETAVKLAGEMAYGTGKLLTQGGFTPESLQARVSVPGGITAVGLGILRQELDDAFNRVIRATHAKYEEDLERVDAMFYGQSIE